VLLNARLLDRHRFAHQFRGGPADAVVAALQSYVNPDGGFGHALEPDLRGPGSQPEPVEVALWTLHETGDGRDRDVAFADPMVRGACDCLRSITTPDDVIDRHLDVLVAAQSADGGWEFNWPAWADVTVAEWRGHVTVDQLKTLRAHGRWAV
jgi:hypothetical protein